MAEFPDPKQHGHAGILAALAVFQGMLPTVATMVAGAWIAFTYLNDRRETEKKEYITRLVEVRKPFLTKQLELYNDTLKITGQFAHLTPDSEEWKKAKERFTELYWSELALVETIQVAQAMKCVDTRMNEHENSRSDLSLEAFQNSILELARQIHGSIEKEWMAGIETRAVSSDQARISEDGCEVRNDRLVWLKKRGRRRPEQEITRRT